MFKFECKSYIVHYAEHSCYRHVIFTNTYTSNCMRKLHQYVRRNYNLNKALLSMSSVRYRYCKWLLKIKKEDVTKLLNRNDEKQLPLHSKRLFHTRMQLPRVTLWYLNWYLHLTIFFTYKNYCNFDIHPKKYK